MKPFILYYGYGPAGELGAKLHLTLEQSRAPFRCLKKEDLDRKLADIVAEGPDETSRPAPETGDLPLGEIGETHPFLLFCHFSQELLGAFWPSLTQTGANRIPLKACLTEENQKWTPHYLIEDLYEHYLYEQQLHQTEAAAALEEQLNKKTEN